MPACGPARQRALAPTRQSRHACTKTECQSWRRCELRVLGAAHPTILERSRLEPNAKYRTLPPSTYTLSGRRPTPATGTTQSTSILSERRGRFVAGDAGRVGHRTAPRDRCLPGQRANMQVEQNGNSRSWPIADRVKTETDSSEARKQQIKLPVFDTHEHTP